MTPPSSAWVADPVVPRRSPRAAASSRRTYGIPTAPSPPTSTRATCSREMRALGAALPFVYTPHPVVSMPRETLYSYIEGDDPLTGKRVIDEIVDALTKTPGEAAARPTRDQSAAPHAEGSSAREEMLAPDTEDNLQRLFYERGWTDGLPVILPTAGAGGAHAHRHRPSARRAGGRDLQPRHQGDDPLHGRRHRRGGGHGRGAA